MASVLLLLAKTLPALKKKGLLRRIGQAGGGHWEVVGATPLS